MNISDDYDSFTNCKDNEDEDKNINLKDSLSSIPSSVILLFFIGLINWTML